MEKKTEKKNIFVKMVEDKRSIIKSIREGVPTKTIEDERNVKFVHPYKYWEESMELWMYMCAIQSVQF